MSRIAYVDGRYVPMAAARVHVEDRGYQFADGVYEVVAVWNGRLIDDMPHMERLARSCRELDMAMPMGDGALLAVLRETARQNGVRRGIVYLQVTRGVARRDHAFPRHSRPVLVVTSRRAAGPSPALLENGVKVSSVRDIRWRRCDIKSVALLPNVLAKQRAREQEAYEAWQVDDDGNVTEGSSTNAWIVDADGALVTRPADHAILNGITRMRLIQLARDAGIPVVERPFGLEEAKRAREAFITSTTSFVTPVVQIDDAVIANGRPGSIAGRLRALYMEFLEDPEAAPADA